MSESPAKRFQSGREVLSYFIKGYGRTEDPPHVKLGDLDVSQQAAQQLAASLVAGLANDIKARTAKQPAPQPPQLSK